VEKNHGIRAQRIKIKASITATPLRIPWIAERFKPEYAASKAKSWSAELLAFSSLNSALPNFLLLIVNFNFTLSSQYH